jgi:hypothetical protein
LEVRKLPPKKAAAIPEHPWIDGNADIIPMPGDAVETVPLENVPAGSKTISRVTHPLGVVLIPPTPPVGTYAVLPLEVSKEESETVDVGGQESPNGIVVLFKSHA